MYLEKLNEIPTAAEVLVADGDIDAIVGGEEGICAEVRRMVVFRASVEVEGEAGGVKVVEVESRGSPWMKTRPGREVVGVVEEGSGVGDGEGEEVVGGGEGVCVDDVVGGDGVGV